MGCFLVYGASWIMSNEDFLNGISAIDYAKLSVNYGSTGNDRIFYPGEENYVAYENQYQISENNETHKVCLV